MKKILIIAEPGYASEDWAIGIIKTERDYDLVKVNRRDSLLTAQIFQEEKFSCILFQCEKLNEDEFTFVRTISELAKDPPILILSEQINIYSYGQVHAMQNMVALQSPCDSKMLLSMMDKIVEGQSFKTDRCPRFITNEPVRLVVMRTGHLVPTRMRNYSAGGAFLEYRGIAMQVGDLIQLNLGSAKTRFKEDQFLVEGKVIWIREGDNSRSPARGIGIQFIDPETKE